MQKFYYSHGQADIEATQLAVWAYEGREDLIFQAPIDWSTEGTHILYAAILGQHFKLCKRLLTLGSPVDFSIYRGATDYFPLFLPELPANPAVMEKIETDSLYGRFNWAIVREQKQLVFELLPKVWNLNLPILLTHGMGEMRPIEYAVRKGNIDIMSKLIQAGADVTILSSEGKSLSRLILESDLEPNVRKKCFELLKKQGVNVIPAASTWTGKLRTYLALRISSED